MTPLTETWHRVAWLERDVPHVVDHATAALAARHEAELTAAGWKPLVYPVQFEAVEEAL